MGCVTKQMRTLGRHYATKSRARSRRLPLRALSVIAASIKPDTNSELRGLCLFSLSIVRGGAEDSLLLQSV